MVSDGSPALRARDAAVQRFAEVGRRAWDAESGYRQQGRVENTLGRYKRMFGGQLRARSALGQQAEVLAACGILNRMLDLGAARSFARAT